MTAPLVLYTRAGCPPCEARAAALTRLGLRFIRVDVDDDPALARRYGARVPVLVTSDGLELVADRDEMRGIG